MEPHRGRGWGSLSNAVQLSCLHCGSHGEAPGQCAQRKTPAFSSTAGSSRNSNCFQLRFLAMEMRPLDKSFPARKITTGRRVAPHPLEGSSFPFPHFFEAHLLSFWLGLLCSFALIKNRNPNQKHLFKKSLHSPKCNP